MDTLYFTDYLAAVLKDDCEGMEEALSLGLNREPNFNFDNMLVWIVIFTLNKQKMLEILVEHGFNSSYIERNKLNPYNNIDELIVKLGILEEKKKLDKNVSLPQKSLGNVTEHNKSNKNQGKI